jgi:hypothetical protein
MIFSVNIKKYLIICFSVLAEFSEVMNILKSANCDNVNAKSFFPPQKSSNWGERRKLHCSTGGKTFFPPEKPMKISFVSFSLITKPPNNRKRVEQLWQHEKQQHSTKNWFFPSFLFHFCSFLSARLPFTHRHTYTKLVRESVLKENK